MEGKDEGIRKLMRMGLRMVARHLDGEFTPRKC